MEALVKADTAQVPDIVKQLSDYRKWADPLLEGSLSSSADDSVEKLHLSLALLDQDERQVDYLYRQLLRTESQRFPVLRDALEKHQEPLRERLWEVIARREQDPKHERLHAAAALAQYDPTNPQWNTAAAEVVAQLATVSPVFLRDWMTALRPVRAKLLSPLGVIYRDPKRRESERSLVTEVLADYAADTPEVLAELVKDADETQFAIVFSRLQEHGKAAIPLLESELQRTLTPDWQDPPLSDDWRPVEPLLVTQIEAAKGLLTERFAFCQSMPLDQFPAICEALRASGYRPTRVRPYLSLLPLAGGEGGHRPDEGVYVAAIWTRWGNGWNSATSLAASTFRQQSPTARSRHTRHQRRLAAPGRRLHSLNGFRDRAPLHRRLVRTFNTAGRTASRDRCQRSRTYDCPNRTTEAKLCLGNHNQCSHRCQWPASLYRPVLKSRHAHETSRSVFWFGAG